MYNWRPCATASESAARAAESPRKPAAMVAAESDMMRESVMGSPRLRDDVDECGSAALDDVQRALQRGFQLVWISDRAGSPHAQAAGEHAIVDIRVCDRGAEIGLRHPSLTATSHAQD